jgi:hypothetical protein
MLLFKSTTNVVIVSTTRTSNKSECLTMGRMHAAVQFNYECYLGRYVIVTHAHVKEE